MAKGFLPKATQVRSWRSGRLISETTLGDAAVERYGAPYYHIHRGDLIETLAAAVSAEANIHLRLSSGMSRFTQSADGVRLVAGGQEHQLGFTHWRRWHSLICACVPVGRATGELHG